MKVKKVTTRHAGHKVGTGLPPLIVGVINISPESFYSGSVITNEKSFESKIAEMTNSGAKCIDVGGMSTRPIELYGGVQANIREEMSRIKKHLPSIVDIAETYSIPVAIDTQFSEIAQRAVDLGCVVVNDISGFKTDNSMASYIGSVGVDVVVMATQINPGDVCGINSTIRELKKSISIGLDNGINRNSISIDPAFGSWQGRESNCDLELIRNFKKFSNFRLPIYIGVSRKSTIESLNGGKTAEDRLAGSLVLTNWLVKEGANIIRTHDVKDTILALDVFKSLSLL